MNEAETRAELIDPALKAAGWGVIEGSRIKREVITFGRLQGAGTRAKQDIADYVLVYRNQKLAVIEAKWRSAKDTEGLGQAKNYAHKLQTRFAFSTNGAGIYRVDMQNGEEGNVGRYPTPDELWEATFAESQAQERFWRNRFSTIPFEDKGGQWQARYYQHNAITKTLDTVARGHDRILLTLATGTGKTAIAFQIVWKLFHSRWNLTDWRTGLEDGREPKRRPRILFLTDRNILADQAFNEFSAFPDDALVRIAPDVIRKRGNVPKNGSVFFTIFQTFMTGNDCEGNPKPSFGDYPPDFFDLIVIDECHRGGANDESSWRDIMEYFAPAVQLGLTATPKRKHNVDTYAYFGDPVYEYSLKEGINDGYLTPFKVKQIATTLDDYVYTLDDDVIEGEIEEGKLYTEPDFNRIIEIKEREKKRVEIFMNEIDPRQKTLVFCATQIHALAVRDLINQMKTSTDPKPRFERIKIKLADGRERTIQHMIATSFWSPDGKPMSAAQFVERLFGELPGLFKDEDELRRLWSRPDTRRKLLEGLDERGFGKGQLVDLKRLIDAENSDLYDVLAYIAFARAPISRQERVSAHKSLIFAHCSDKQREFIDFVLGQYINQGVGELDQEKLPHLLELKYHAVSDAVTLLGNVNVIRETFIGFQKHLYAQPVAG